MPTPTFPVRIANSRQYGICVDFGPWKINGAWYAVSKGNTQRWDVSKSVDEGATWAFEEEGPTSQPSPIGVGGTHCLRAGGFIKVLHVNNYVPANPSASTQYVIKAFDPSIDEWGEDSAIGPEAVPVGITGFEFTARIVQISNGDVYLFYTFLDGSDVEIRYAVLSSGGTWTAPAVLTSADFCYLHTLVADPNDVIHVFYKTSASLDPTGDLKHITLTTEGDVGSPQIVDGASNIWFAGPAAIWGSAILVPYFDADGLAGVWSGTPYSAPVPEWSWTLVNTTAAAGTIDAYTSSPPDMTGFAVYPFLFTPCAKPVLVWRTSKGPLGSYEINQVWASTNPGTGWTTPTLIYDEILDPPDWIAAGNNMEMYAISAGVIDGSLRVVGDIDLRGLAYLGSDDSGEWPTCAGGYRNRAY